MSRVGEARAIVEARSGSRSSEIGLTLHSASMTPPCPWSRIGIQCGVLHRREEFRHDD